MRRVLIPIVCVLAVVLELAEAPTASATPTLYAVSLNGFIIGRPGPSKLYTIDSVTGTGTLIGEIGHAVNAIAMDPTTGKLYGSTTTWSGAFNGLLEIDPLTASATEIGPFGGAFTAIVGLTFNSTGELYGWHEPTADDLVRIDKATGAATTVGEAGLSTGAHVLAFDNADNLTLSSYGSVYDINTTTGAATFSFSPSFNPGSGGADFDPMTGLLWAPLTFGGENISFIRVTDLGGSSFTDIHTDVSYLNALTFGVPEPSLSLLLACGLVGLGVRRRLH
jgi:hypothetical protein